MSFSVETKATLTCSRCKTALSVEIPPPPNRRNPDLDHAFAQFEADDANDFEMYCREKSDEERKKQGWSIVSFHNRGTRSYHICAECSSDLSSFLTSIESFTATDDGRCLIFDGFCSNHEFHHGAEATELREGIEKILRRHQESDLDPTDFDVLLTRLIENVDARDSLAYAEYLEKEHAQETQETGAQEEENLGPNRMG